VSLRSALTCLAVALATIAIAEPAEARAPSRVAIVEPEGDDPVVREAITRLRAELVASGFVVLRAQAKKTGERHRDVERAGASEGPFATIAIVRTDRGAAAEIWVADHLTDKTLVRRVDTDATDEARLPTALAIRAVDLLRASLLEVQARSAPKRPQPIPPDVARFGEVAAPTLPLPPPRALLEGVSVMLGVSALYGMGDSTGRLAPTLRVSYGAPNGLAGRLTMLGPTATDQLGLLEIVYGFDRSFRTVAPVLSAGLGACHSHMEGSGGPESRKLITSALAVIVGGSAGVAVRARDRAAVLLDVHAFLVDPLSGSVIARESAAGEPSLFVGLSLGVVAGF
jgi:hypothetical protein